MIRCFFFLFSSLLMAQSVADSTQVLTVGYAGSEPYVIEGEIPRGIAMEVFKELNLAGETVDFSASTSEVASSPYIIPEMIVYQSYTSIDNAIEALNRKELDMLVGPISITPNRAEKVHFSLPYTKAKLAILSNAAPDGWWARFSPLFSWAFLYAVLGFFLILTIVGLLIWLVERKKSPDQFSKHPVKGVGTGIWLALVTMTTVGYGDYAPRTVLGKFITGTWMIISLVMATSFVAGIATTITMIDGKDLEITSLSQLDGKKVATPATMAVRRSIREMGGRAVQVSHAKEGLEKLKAESLMPCYTTKSS
jgi:polar amino acid transport system substrate-binding protein